MIRNNYVIQRMTQFLSRFDFFFRHYLTSRTLTCAYFCIVAKGKDVFGMHVCIVSGMTFSSELRWIGGLFQEQSHGLFSLSCVSLGMHCCLFLLRNSSCLGEEFLLYIRYSIYLWYGVFLGIYHAKGHHTEPMGMIFFHSATK